MKRNFKKILACTLALSSLFSVTSLNISAEESISEELKTFIYNSTPSEVISENCKVYSICFIGIDENGNEMYDFATRDKETGEYIILEEATLLGFNEDGEPIVGGYYDKLIWFDENNNPEIVKTIDLYSENGFSVYETIDVITGEKIIVISNNWSSPGCNVIARYGDTNCDGDVDIRDVTALNQHIIQTDELEDYMLIMSDVTGDDTVDIKDLGQLKKYMIGLIDTL